MDIGNEIRGHTEIIFINQNNPMSNTRKILINYDYGEFELSLRGVMLYSEFAKLNLQPVESKPNVFIYYVDGIETAAYVFDPQRISRDDPDLIRVFEILGKGTGGVFSTLKMVEIPADVDWAIQEVGGAEYVAERHRTWY